MFVFPREIIYVFFVTFPGFYSGKKKNRLSVVGALFDIVCIILCLSRFLSVSSYSQYCYCVRGYLIENDRMSRVCRVRKRRFFPVKTIITDRRDHSVYPITIAVERRPDLLSKSNLLILFDFSARMPRDRRLEWLRRRRRKKSFRDFALDDYRKKINKINPTP